MTVNRITVLNYLLKAEIMKMYQYEHHPSHGLAARDPQDPIGNVFRCSAGAFFHLPNTTNKDASKENHKFAEVRTSGKQLKIFFLKSSILKNSLKGDDKSALKREVCFESH